MRNLFVDVETYYDRKIGYDLKAISLTEYIRDPRFKLQGLAYCWQDEGTTHWISGDHVVQAWTVSVDWMSTRMINHNSKFDASVLLWRFGVRAAQYFDTVALAKAVLGENVSGYHLKGLAEYLGLPAKGELKWDGVRDLTKAQEAEMAEYCKNDTDICKGIYEKLIRQFPHSQLFSVDWTIRAFIEPRLRLDKDALIRGVEDEKARREEAIKKSGVDKSVLASNKQFAEHLRTVGLNVPTKLSLRTGKSIPAFARTDDGLAELMATAPDLYAARIASKANLLETRGESLLAVAKTGPFPFDVGFSGAVQTHRYSGGSGAGGNPQNFTRKSFLREAVCAPDSHSLIVGDFAAIELRILSWLAREPKLINKLVNDEDVYMDFAALLQANRFFGKCAILGLGYGMGGDKFQKTVKQQLKQDITEDAAWKTVNLYRTTYFNVPKLWEHANALLPLISSGSIGCIWFAPFLKAEKCAIILPSGLRIRYPNLRQVEMPGPRGPRMEWVYDVYRKKYEVEQSRLYGGKLIENICQALAGELCKEAIQRAEEMGLQCVGQVHDEILAVCRQDSVEGQAEKEAVLVLRQAMEKSPKWWAEIRLKSEVGYGNTWNEAKS